MRSIVLMLVLIFLIATNGCRKSEVKSVAPNSQSDTSVFGPYSSIEAAFSEFSPKMKSVTIDAASGSAFFGNSGSRYIFPPYAFVMPDGNFVTGEVNVRVLEILGRSDMIFSGVLPISNGEPLISGGECYVMATKNGTSLKMAPNKEFCVILPVKNDTAAPPMKLFIGTDNAGKVNWEPADNSDGRITAHVFERFDSVVGGLTLHNDFDSISMFISKMGWANADRFMTNPNYQTYTVILKSDSITDFRGVNFYTIYDELNGVWPGGEISGNVITEDHVPNIPVHFVAYMLWNGHFYSGIFGVTPVTGSRYEVTLKRTDLSEFRKQVLSL